MSYTTIVGFLRADSQTHRHFEASRLFFLVTFLCERTEDDKQRVLSQDNAESSNKTVFITEVSP